MKNLLTFILLLFSSVLSVYSQSLEMFYTETSQYPYLTTSFKLFDSQGNEVRNSPTLKPITKDDIVIYEMENGQVVQREVLADPDCPPQTLTTFSAVLVCDISNSMLNKLPSGQTNIDALKEVLKDWADKFDPKRTETAITAFCSEAVPKDWDLYPNDPIRPFTTDRDSLILAIDSLPDICTGTNYNAAFLHSKDAKFITKFSGLYWCKPEIAKYKPVIVFLTDGNHNPQTAGSLYGGAFQLFEVVNIAMERNVTIYVVQIGDEVIEGNNLSDLQSLSLIGRPSNDVTPNLWMGITSASELKDIYQQILMEAGTLGDPPPCYIPWKAGCEGGSATFTFPNHGNLVGVSDYNIAQNKKPSLEVTTSDSKNFENISTEDSSIKNITLTAQNNSVEVTGANIKNKVRSAGKYEIIDWGSKSPPPFVIEKDENYDIRIKYTATDSLFTAVDIEFEGLICSGNEISLSSYMIPFVETIDMGNVKIGEKSSSTFSQVFCNKTGQSFNIINDPRITGQDSDNFTCISPINPLALDSGMCLEMVFEFQPNGTPGKKTAQIELSTDYKGFTVFKGDIIGNATGDKTLSHIYSGFDSVNCNTGFTDNIIYLENQGSESINNVTCSILPPNDVIFQITNTPPSTINPLEQAPISIRFNPPSLQNSDFTGILRIESDAQNSPYDIPIVGPMRNIDFAFSAAVDFGEVCVGTQQTRQVTITNTGNVTINVDVSSTAPFVPAFTTYIIPVGGNEQIDVVCEPLSDGVFNSNLIITNTECNLTKTIALSATGVYPMISFDKLVNLTATIGDTDESDINVTNESASSVTITAIEPCDDVRFSISNINPSPLPQTIQPGGTISFKVTYTPQIGDATLLNSCLQFIGTTCNFDTSVAITGNPDLAIVDIEIDDHTGFDGQLIDIPVYLRNGNRFDKSNTKTVSCDIRYDGSLLEAQPPFVAQNDPILPFKIIQLANIPVQPINTEQIIETLKFNIKNIGTAKITALEILNPTGNGGAGFIIKDGLFTLSEYAAVISIDTVSAKLGEIVEIPIYLFTGAPIGPPVTGIAGKISFNSSVLFPVPPTEMGDVDIDSKIRTIPITLPIQPVQDNILGSLFFRVTLGNTGATTLSIDSIYTVGSNNSLTPVNGFVRILGICNEGDTYRLVDLNQIAGLKIIMPNPGGDKVNIEYEMIEDSHLKIYIINQLGEIIKIIKEKNIIHGNYMEEVNINELSTGSYFMVFETPTIKKMEKLEIIR